MQQEKAAPQLPSLTSLRAIAALLVAVHHTRDAWAHFSLIHWLGEVGWLGVSYFFILSGFVLMWGFDPAQSKARFVVRRLIRIYPLHAFCLVASLTSYGLAHHALSGYAGTPLATALNFLLLHAWIPNQIEIRHAWNGPSWTLSCEFFFYLCAPFIFPSLRKEGAAEKAFLPLILISGLFLALSFAALQRGWLQILEFLHYLPVPRLLEFVLGACGAQMLRSGWRPPSRGLAFLVMVLPVTIYCFLTPDTDLYRRNPAMIQLSIPGALLLIMACAAYDNEGRATWLHKRRLVFLGEASFAFYMVHTLWLGVFGAIKRSLFPIAAQSALAGEVATLVYLAVALGLAIATHIGFEQPVRLWMMRKFTARKSLVAIVPGS